MRDAIRWLFIIFCAVLIMGFSYFQSLVLALLTSGVWLLV